MRLLPVLVVFTLIEAKRRRPGDLDKISEDLIRNYKTNDVDLYPKSFDGVDFGHVYRDKNRDPNERTDIFDLAMQEPKSVEHARQLLRQAGSVGPAKTFDEPLAFASPRDAMMYLNPSGRREAYESDKMAFRPGGIRDYVRSKSNPGDEGIKQNRPSPNPPQENRRLEEGFTNTSELSGYFSRGSFDLISDEPKYKVNWTTCKEFAKGAVFHPDDIINIEWVPFYIWSERQFTISHVHKFSYLTKKAVKLYKEKYDRYLNMKVNWEEPKLLMRELTDILLIAGDRKGLFYGIQLLDLPDNVKKLKIKVPVMVLRLKIVDPYLALMYCNENYASIMTAAGNEPGSPEEKTSEAKKALKFNGIGYPANRDIKGETIRSKYKHPRLSTNYSEFINV